jgi:hypothetical protein
MSIIPYEITALSHGRRFNPNIRATVVRIEATVAATKLAAVDEPGSYAGKVVRRP